MEEDSHLLRTVPFNLESFLSHYVLRVREGTQKRRRGENKLTQPDKWAEEGRQTHALDSGLRFSRNFRLPGGGELDSRC